MKATVGQFTFDQLVGLIKKSDTRNPNKEQIGEAENTLKQLGFYNESDEIRSKLFQEGKTTDGKTLVDLEEWFEINMC